MPLPLLNRQVPHCDIINIFPKMDHRCCGGTMLARVRALPPRKRVCTGGPMWIEGDKRPVPQEPQVRRAAKLLQSYGAQCPAH